MVAARCALSILFFGEVHGHGQMNHPPSTRQGITGKTTPGSLFGGGYCEQPWGAEKQPFHHNSLNGACMLFSQPSSEQPDAAVLPVPPTNNAKRFRSVNVDVSSGPGDWTRSMPWRAPGWAPVLGSGCGVAGGGNVWNHNGGWPARGMSQGQDALTLPGPEGGPVTTWEAGSIVEVALGIWANHAGGYSYRLCPNEPGKVDEACFQATPLKFAGETQWLHHINGMRFEIPLVKLSEGTYPEGSEWARLPFPECEAAPCMDSPQACQAKVGIKDNCASLAFPEPIPWTHGFGHNNNSHAMDGFHDFSVVDRVILPENLTAGDYLISWRWDCEQTQQIWQNCADVHIRVAGPTPTPPPAPPAKRCDFTGIWLNQEVNIRVNITQEAAVWRGSCMDGTGWQDGAGAVASAYGQYPQGGATLRVPSSGELTTGIFSTSSAKGAPECSQIDWDDHSTWCREPYCPSSLFV